VVAPDAACRCFGGGGQRDCARRAQPNQGGCDCQMQEPLDLYVLRPLIAADLHADKIRLGLDEVACLHCWSSIFGSDHHL